MKKLKSATLLLSIGCSDMMEESVNYAGYIKFLPMYLLSPFAIFPFLNWDNKAGHLLSEPGFDPHSTPQFRDLSSNFAKQNSTP